METVSKKKLVNSENVSLIMFICEVPISKLFNTSRLSIFFIGLFFSSLISLSIFNNFVSNSSPILSDSSNSGLSVIFILISSINTVIKILSGNCIPVFVLIFCFNCIKLRFLISVCLFRSIIKLANVVLSIKSSILYFIKLLLYFFSKDKNAADINTVLSSKLIDNLSLK